MIPKLRSRLISLLGYPCVELFSTHLNGTSSYSLIYIKRNRPDPISASAADGPLSRTREILIGYFNGGLGYLTGYIKNRFIITGALAFFLLTQRILLDDCPVKRPTMVQGSLLYVSLVVGFSFWLMCHVWITKRLLEHCFLLRKQSGHMAYKWCI